MTSHRLWLALWLLAACVPSFPPSALAAPATPAPAETAAAPAADPSQIAQAQPAPAAPAPAPAATPDPAPSPTPDASAEPIGNVATLTGVATVIRNKDSIALKLKDDIYLNDMVQTSASSSLGVTFNDGTTFHLSSNAKITIDTYVYEDGGNQNAGIFDIAKGTVAFVAAAVAKTGDMKITTPTSSLGIRGTTGLVEVPEGGGAAGATSNIKLYPDPDGHVGRIEVSDRAGARLGALTQGASGFSIRPPAAPGGRVSAAPLTISREQVARDQGFVRQVHAAQGVGRQIVTEQRAIRRANPNLNRPNQPRPQAAPPAQRPNNLPGQPKQQPGTPNRQGGQPQPGATPQPGAKPQQPGAKPQPAQPNRQGSQQPGQERRQPQQPGQPQRAGQPPGEREKPGAVQPALPPRPGENLRQGGEPGAPPRQNLREPGFRQGAPNLPRPGAQRPPRRPTFAPPRRGPPPKGKRQRPQ